MRTNKQLAYRCKKCGLIETSKGLIFNHSCFENMVEVSYWSDRNKKHVQWRRYSYEKREPY